MPSKKPAVVPAPAIDKKPARHIPWEPCPATLWIKNPVWNAWQARGIARMMPGFKVRPVR